MRDSSAGGGGGVASADVPVLARLGTIISEGAEVFGVHAQRLDVTAAGANATNEQFDWVVGVGAGSRALSALYSNLGEHVAKVAEAFRLADAGTDGGGEVETDSAGDVVGGPARLKNKKKRSQPRIPVVLVAPPRKGSPKFRPLPETLPADPIQARIAAARSQVGYREGDGNKTAFGDWFGSPDQPWCASFVSWAFATAGQPLPPINGKNGFSRVEHGQNYARRNGQLSKTPKVGDIFMTVNPKTGKGHTGIVVAVLPGGRIQTIEGNTNQAGSREGTHVIEKERTITGRMRFWTVPPPA
jgi:hypothetical protein